jgi:hypothetical protein
MRVTLVFAVADQLGGHHSAPDRRASVLEGHDAVVDEKRASKKPALRGAVVLRLLDDVGALLAERTYGAHVAKDHLR